MAHISSMNAAEFAKYDDELNDILKSFHTAVFDLIYIAENVDPKNYYITWVKQQIDIFRKIDKENIIKRMKNKLWENHKQIMNHDLDFFKQDKHITKYIKNDENREFMFSVINMLKKKIETLSPEELEAVWNVLEQILAACIDYKRLVHDYDIE